MDKLVETVLLNQCNSQIGQHHVPVVEDDVGDYKLIINRVAKLD